MSTPAGPEEPTVAEREAQRLAEQEALRKVRKLTDNLEAEQRDQRRVQRWGLLLGVAGLVILLAAVAAVYFKARLAPPPAKLEVPPKVVVPQK